MCLINYNYTLCRKMSPLNINLKPPNKNLHNPHDDSTSRTTPPCCSQPKLLLKTSSEGTTSYPSKENAMTPPTHTLPRHKRQFDAETLRDRSHNIPPVGERPHRPDLRQTRKD